MPYLPYIKFENLSRQFIKTTPNIRNTCILSFRADKNNNYKKHLTFQLQKFTKKTKLKVSQGSIKVEKSGFSDKKSIIIINICN